MIPHKVRPTVASMKPVGPFVREYLVRVLFGISGATEAGATPTREARSRYAKLQPPRNGTWGSWQISVGLRDKFPESCPCDTYVLCRADHLNFFSVVQFPTIFEITCYQPRHTPQKALLRIPLTALLRANRCRN